MDDNNYNQNNNQNNNDNKKKPGGFNGMIGAIVVAVVLSIVFIMAFNNYRASGEKEISYDKFVQMLEDGNVKDVEIYEKKIKFTPTGADMKTENVTYYVIRTDDYKLIERLDKADVKYTAIDEGGNAILSQILYYVILIAVMYFLTMMIMRRVAGGSGGIMNVGKSNAKLYDMTKNTGVTFSDVAGEEEAKESLTEMVDFLKEPKKYLEIGARLPKGALLVGPPGTGKTLLAKAVAGEAGVPFFSMSGSEFVEMYVGVGASRVRDLFKQATAKAPCIIFIDEIDAIGRSRDTRHMGGDSEREQTLNQLLSEMDGFDSEKGIIILAATNRPEVLDKALLRPGRFDRRVIVEKPDLKGREDILKVHTKDVKLDETVDLREIANVTSGSVGADLENIINEAALTAVRKGRRFVCQNDILESIEVVFAGKEKKNNILSADEKSIVAYHEAGHALLSVLQKNTMPVQKITIVPRTKGSLGYVWQAPEEEKNLETKAELEADIVIAVGGRAAEALKFPSVTNGASNDIEQATRTARTMVTMYGMSERFGMVQLEGITGEYLDRRRVLECSDETATLVDEEVKMIINNAYARAYKLLSENIAILDAVATFLIDHETITGKEFMNIYNQITGGVAPKVDKAVSLTAGNILAPTFAKVTEPSYSYSEDSKSDGKLKVGEKLKDKLKKQKKKKSKEEKKAKEKKEKFKVYVSPEFEAKRDELLNDDSIDEIENSTENSVGAGSNISEVVASADISQDMTSVISSGDTTSSTASEGTDTSDDASEELVIESSSQNDAETAAVEEEKPKMPWDTTE
ncbi:cell division protease FtsH [Lachnospiraceae bacterium NE2001]|nr:cell division protease FtsH [Lachnospiraceae bacterium NE2001]